MARQRAAASSMASGMPSSRAQISATWTPLPSSRAKPGRARAARSANSCTASYPPRTSAVTGARDGGAGSDGTRQLTSPGTPSGSLLVASTVKLAHRASSRPARSAHDATRCSQLSSTSRTGRSPTKRAMASAAASVTVSRTPSALATGDATASGFPRVASSTHQHRIASRLARCAAASTASRVLPTPPAPVSVTRRLASRHAPIAASSPLRPISGDIWPGRWQR
jgi:hypothetical protein